MSVFVPVGLTAGPAGQFEAVHRESGATVHWHLDEDYVASTWPHQIALSPELANTGSSS
jgi:hypothetical protein